MTRKANVSGEHWATSDKTDWGEIEGEIMLSTKPGERERDTSALMAAPLDGKMRVLMNVPNRLSGREENETMAEKETTHCAMQQEMTFRDASLHDVEAIAALHAESWRRQ